MSINPVPVIPPASDPQGSETAVRLKNAQASTAAADASPVSGTQPKQNSATPLNTSRATNPLQDEVDLQHDAQTGGDIIVQYKDQSGNLILQLPNSQVLSVARSIYQDFRAEAKARSGAAQTGNEGGNRHGN
jgi:hypothetical protein